MKVKDMMHQSVEWVSPNTVVTTVAKKMKKLDIGAIPVGEDDRLIGMITDRDITMRALANGKDVSSLTARDVMSKGVFWCRDSDDKVKRRRRRKRRIRTITSPNAATDSFERYFTLPQGIDANKIEASFKNGVLRVSLPKTAEAQKPAKKIEVKAA